MEFNDIGAVVYLLRKVIWLIPGFTVDTHYIRLHRLHDQILQQGPFIAHSTRTLTEAVKR